jgi:DNA-binding SARP family transcriptional activator/WD40 repeat protein
LRREHEVTPPAAINRERDGPTVEYRVLGPLAATSGQARVELGGKRQRLVLAVLLSNANRVITQDALADAVWNGDLPDRGPRSLHTYVSQLRKALHGGIERDGEGYVLAVDPEQVDALRFDALVEEARSTVEDDPAGAATMLRRGLGMWAGTAYGDLGFEPALSGEANRLAEERVAALELRFEVDLLLGRHEQIVSEIEALLREQPYREHLAAMLMLALYRAGRQAEALRVYRNVRHRLVQELGIEPGQELQDLELRILEGDPVLRAPSAGVRGSGPDEVPGARGYEIHERIGTTEFGDRYRGFHGTMGREVGALVIDQSSANSAQFIRQFEAEMQTVSRFEHPHLAPVFDYWRDPSTAYVITPFYRGGSLGAAIADKPLMLGGAIRLADQLSAALGFLHRQGYPHGAVSAGSVFLDEEMNAYLTDTGLPRILGHGHQDEPDDIYQLGALVYQALTLRRPDGVLRVSELRGDLPSELDHALSRALHPDPALRYQRVEELARALRQSAGLDFMALPTQTAPEGRRRNPYKGLRAFQEADASDFHGRDALVEEMAEALTASRLLAVVGPSGSGKSSVVRAGLVPRLRQGFIASSEDWLITDMFPGAHPFESLEGALLRVAATRPGDLYDTLTADASGLGRIVDQLVEPGSEILVVIDQFEELFSMVSSTTERRLFLDCLVAATGIDSRLRIMLTLRADFFDQPLQYPEFADVFRSNLVAVSPPTRDGLARAVSQPALNAGVSLEPGLVTRIVEDVSEQPGGLPLLQFALTELFAQRDGDTLTLDAYDRSGGVGGALAKRAEDTYSSLTPAGQEAARQLFLRLVTVDELADDTRRRVRQSELLGLDIDRVVMSDTMQQFGALRFLSFDRDPASRAPTVELAHESLLREWQRLRTWIDERREDLLIHRRIQLTVQEWESSDRDQSYLLRGSRLEQAMEWADRTDIAVSNEEIAFIEASVENERQERAEREALEDKARRRRRAAMGALAGGLVVAGVLGAVALDRAGDARVTAAQATARDLSSAAIAAIDEDPELGVLLSLESVAATDAVGVDSVPEAASALRTTLAEMRIEARIPGFQAVAYSGDGSRLVTDDAVDPSGLNLWNTKSTGAIAQWTRMEGGLPPAAEVTNVTFSPDDDLVAVSWLSLAHIPGSGRAEFERSDDEGMIAVTLHESMTLDHLASLHGEPGSYWAPSFGAGGLVAASFIGATRGGAYVWNGESGEVVDVFANSTVTSGTFIPGTPYLVLGQAPDGLQAIDMTTSAEVWTIHGLGFTPGLVALSPDGLKAAISGEDLVEVWDLETQTQLHVWPHADPQVLTWSLNGSRLAVSGNDADITIFEVDRSEPLMTLTGHKSSVWSTAFHPNGETLASASEDGEVLIWDVTEAGGVGDDAVALGSPVGLIFLGPDSRMIAGSESGATTVDLTTGRVEATLPINEPFDLIPNDRLTTVAGVNVLGPVPVGHLVDARSGEITEVFSDCFLPRGISFDDQLVALDAMEACVEGATSTPSQIRSLVDDEMLIDLGRRVVAKAVFSPEGFDGPPFVAVNADGLDIEIYSLDEPGLVTSYSIDELGVTGFGVLSLDSEGKYLGIGTIGPNSIVIDMAAIMSGTPRMEAVLFNVEGHKANAPQFRVTSDGIGASASFDPVYRVWDITTGEMLFEIEVEGLDDLGAVNFTPDGTQLAYEDANGVIRFTPLDTDEVVARARATVTRSLTDDECRQYLQTDGCVDESL